jgi:hypothetical protein
MEISNSTKELLIKVNEKRQKYFPKDTEDNNYNVFEALKITHSEVRHSAFISDLLNVNGKHGQKEKFLSIFIDTIKSKYNIKGFDDIKSIKTESEVDIQERFPEIGLGRVDIIITAEKPAQHIIIENKINARDGENQLLRYSEITKLEPNSYLFYLTLDGKFPSSKSTGNDKNKIEYETISYKKDIVEWLKKCLKEIEEIDSKSYLFKTINHYINLIRNLIRERNKQSINIELAEDIINLVTKESNHEGFEAFLNLLKATDKDLELSSEKEAFLLLKDVEKEIFDHLLNNFRTIIHEIAEKENLKCWVDLKQDKNYCNFGFYKKEWNYRLMFQFEGKNLTKLRYGFIDDGKGGEEFTKDHKSKFQSQEENNTRIDDDKWHCLVLWQEWENNKDSNYLKIYQAKDIELLIESKVKNLHEIVKPHH